jgi:hypothetical protein
MSSENPDDPAVEQPVRNCPRCSIQSTTAGGHCPHCGATFMRGRRRRSRRFKIVLTSLVAFLLLGGGGAVAALRVAHENDVKAERNFQAAEAARVVQARQARQDEGDREVQRKEDAQKALDTIEVAGRRDLERSLQRSITKDAREQVSNGLLDGSILKTSCDPVGGGRDDLTSRTGKYECIAVTEVRADGSYRGYSFHGTINYKEFSYSWGLGG